MLIKYDNVFLSRRNIIFGNKGMLLENLINKAIKEYKNNNEALFHKKEVNVKIQQLKKDNKKLSIVKGYILEKSTTDYYGIVDGKFIAFEAKSTRTNNLQFAQLKKHQLAYLDKIISYGGYGFIIVGYMLINKFYIIPYLVLMKNASKSINLKFAQKYGYEIFLLYPGKLDFLSKLKELLK